MYEKLIWSWAPEDNRKSALSNDLPEWVEKFAEVTAIFVSLYLLYLMFTPVIASILVFPVIGSIVYISYSIVSTKKKKKAIKNESYLRFFTHGISVNLDGLSCFYKSENINIKSLKIKKIPYSSDLNTCMIKNLCFETQSPKMKIKIPLFRIINENVHDLEKMITQLKFANQ